MKSRIHTYSLVGALAAVVLSLTLPVSVQGQVLALDFAGGDGTTSVDQYTGTTGSGWLSAWSQGWGSDNSNTVATVINTSPLYTGGGDYLHVTYDTGSSTTGGIHYTRESRRWDTTAISLASPVTLSFYFRSDILLANSTQSMLFFGSSAATQSTSANDTWKFSIDGGGISTYNGTTAVLLANAATAGTNTAGISYLFTVVLDATSDTYSASVQRLDTNATFSASGLAFRNTADAGLSYVNIVSNSAGTNLTGVGYSIDGLNVVPEPSSMALLGLGGLALWGLLSAARRKMPQS